MAKQTEEPIAKVEWKGDTVHVYDPDGQIEIWSETIIEDAPIYNGPVPAKIPSLGNDVKHYHDLDTSELYKSYQRIQKMIEDAAEKAKGRGNSTNIEKLRGICQMWLDDVRFRQDGTDRSWIIDRIKYMLKGQYKARLNWLKTFSCICWDMCYRLDAIDGGNDQSQQMKIQSHIGFHQ